MKSSEETRPATFSGVKIEQARRRQRVISADLHRRLQIVWSETSGTRGVFRRFIAQARENGEWGVWDRKTQRFLTGREVVKKTAEELREELAVSRAHC